MDDIDDLFGVDFDAGSEKGNVGPLDQLPPKYKRDAATGRLTGEIEPELTKEEQQVLKADAVEKDKILLERLQRQWSKDGTDERTGLPVDLDEAGRRIRSTDMSLNVLGRSVQAQAAEEELDDGTTLKRDEETGFSQPLTESEFEAFSEFLKEQGIDVSKDDIPTHERTKKPPLSADNTKDSEFIDPDDVDLSLKWLSTRAQREMDDLLDDNPYADLMPGDLSPSRLVNRKRAKALPRSILHHNNIELLKSFLTPTGQIMNRVQTRLGARDQRRIAKLIKRARALGLIPTAGQFKVERHGWIHAKDIHEDRTWEKELAERGLTVQKPSTESSN